MGRSTSTSMDAQNAGDAESSKCARAGAAPLAHGIGGLHAADWPEYRRIHPVLLALPGSAGPMRPARRGFRIR
jgi:hypothetical protein